MSKVIVVNEKAVIKIDDGSAVLACDGGGCEASCTIDEGLDGGEQPICPGGWDYPFFNDAVNEVVVRPAKNPIGTIISTC